MRNENNLIWEAYTDQASTASPTPMSGDEAHSKLRGKVAGNYRITWLDRKHPFVDYIDGVVEELSDTHKAFYGEYREIYVSDWDDLLGNDSATYNLGDDAVSIIWDVSWELFNKNVPYEQAAEIVLDKLGI